MIFSKTIQHSDTLHLLKSLRQTYPNAACALHFSNPLELLVATILSAQCTDERVNIVTQDLFKKYRSARDYAQTKLTILENAIRSTGFFRQKAASIQKTCRMIDDQFHGNVPKTMEELLTLSGVARKTANVVLGTAYKIPSGIVVDTHVKRLAGRINLSQEKDPPKIEQDLMKMIPQKDWIFFGHAMIWHGRKICSARAPNCPQCPLEKMCPKIGIA